MILKKKNDIYIIHLENLTLVRILSIDFRFFLSFYLLNTDATRKRYNAEKYLSKNLEEKDKIEREFVKTREKVNFYRSLLNYFKVFYFIHSLYNLSRKKK